MFGKYQQQHGLPVVVVPPAPSCSICSFFTWSLAILSKPSKLYKLLCSGVTYTSEGKWNIKTQSNVNNYFSNIYTSLKNTFQKGKHGNCNASRVKCDETNTRVWHLKQNWIKTRPMFHQWPAVKFCKCKKQLHPNRLIWFWTIIFGDRSCSY